MKAALKRYALVLPLAAGYFGIFFLFQSKSLIFAKQNYDTFFGGDDGFYFLQVFRGPSTYWDSQIARHPIFAVLGRLIGKIIDVVARMSVSFQSPINQYGLIVAVQCILMALAVILIYRYLVEVVELDRLLSTLLAGMFACSMSALVFSMIVETYSWSGFLLVLMVYLSHNVRSERVQTWGQIGIGAVLSGITVTNGAVWALSTALESYRAPRTLIVRWVGAGLLFVGLLFTQPFVGTFLSQGLPALVATSDTFLTNYAGLGWIQHIFHFLLEAPLFSPIVQQQTVLRVLQGVVLLPKSYPPVWIAGLVWTGILVASAMTVYPEKKTWILYAVLVFAFWLHGVKQFGLNEAFLYSQHHLFAQVLLVGYGLKTWQGKKWMPAVLLAALLAVQIGANSIALRDMLAFAMRYAPR